MATDSETEGDLSEVTVELEDEAKITSDYREKRTAFRLLARRMRDISKGTGGNTLYR
jgi:hypothetical protein